MSYTRYTIPFSTTGGLTVASAVKRFVQDLVAVVPNLSIYDEPSWDSTILKVTNTDYCYLKINSVDNSFMRFYWGIGPSVTNGSSDDLTQVTGTVRRVEVIISDDMLILHKSGTTYCYFGHLTSSIDQSRIEIYGWTNPGCLHPLSDSTYAAISWSVPEISDSQASAMTPSSYFLGEGTWYGGHDSVIKSPWLYLGHGPYSMKGNPTPTTGVYDDHRGNAFWFGANNHGAFRI